MNDDNSKTTHNSLASSSDSFHLIFNATIIVVFSFLFVWRRFVVRYGNIPLSILVTEGPMVRHDVDSVVRCLYEQAMRRSVKFKISYPHQNTPLSDDNNNNLLQLSSQVGGISSHKSRMIRLDPNYVMKPLRLDHRGIREIGFYEAVKAATISDRSYLEFIFVARDKSPPSPITNVDCSPDDIIPRLGRGLFGRNFSLVVDENDNNKTMASMMKLDKLLKEEVNLLRRLNAFIPNYFGVVTKDHVSSFSSSRTTTIIPGSCLVLKDLTRCFSKPCTIDIKIGTHTYEPDAPNDKKIRERAKYPSQLDLGFRIVGFRLYDPSNRHACENGFIRCEKSFGRALSSRDEVKKALIRYLSPRKTSLQRQQQQSKDEYKIVEVNNNTFDSESASLIISSLKPIRQWFLDNCQFRFCASSILIVYEGDNNNTSTIGTDSTTLTTGKVVVKLIDFARVRRDINGDPGSLLGIRTVISLLEEILQENNLQSS